MAVRLLIADDHEVVRTGIKSILADTDIEVVGEATGSEEAVSMVLELNPDIVLLDFRMPGNDGLEALGRIKLDRPKMSVLVLSTYDSPTYVARAVALGANGYLLKTATQEEVVDAVQRVAAEPLSADVHARSDRQNGEHVFGVQWIETNTADLASGRIRGSPVNTYSVAGGGLIAAEPHPVVSVSVRRLARHHFTTHLPVEVAATMTFFRNFV